MEMSDNEGSDPKVPQVEIKKFSKKISKKKSHHSKSFSKVEGMDNGPIDDEEALLKMGDDELEE
jgi:hypothetical protein|tara:strand:+ start:84 stop:275 length:192 start_codon:yes stop_codon:yes gene_type:complete